jgi:hypothetical protein
MAHEIRGADSHDDGHVQDEQICHRQEKRLEDNHVEGEHPHIFAIQDPITAAKDTFYYQ